MSLDRSLSQYREMYQNGTLDSATIDKAFDACYAVLKARGIPIANDDRAENLVAAIAKYVVESQPRPVAEPLPVTAYRGPLWTAEDEARAEEDFEIWNNEWKNPDNG